MLPRPRPGPLEIATDILMRQAPATTQSSNPRGETPDDVAPELPERRELLLVDDDAADDDPPDDAAPAELGEAEVTPVPPDTTVAFFVVELGAPVDDAGPAPDTGTTDPDAGALRAVALTPPVPGLCLARTSPKVPAAPAARMATDLEAHRTRVIADRRRSGPPGSVGTARSSRQPADPAPPPILPMACYLLSVLVQLFISVCESI